MIPRNYKDTVQLILSPKLPALAEKILMGQTTPCTGKESFAHKLEIVPARRRADLTPPGKHMLIDSAYRLNETHFHEKCIYKFSKWQYLVKKLTPSHWRIEVAGDIFSHLVWPYRTVGSLLKVLLCQHGLMSFHSAGFYDGQDVALVLAPSGTGKTLTTIHFLCRGGGVYNDDTVTVKDGKIIPTPWGMHFWEHRYKNAPEILPTNMPVFTGRDKWRLRASRVLKAASLGMVGLGSRLNIAEYWPGSVPPPAEPVKIISLRRGEQLRVDTNTPVEVLRNRLWGDLEYQCLPVLRWRDVETISGIPFFQAGEFFDRHRNFMDKLFARCRLTTITVPARYSREVFECINEAIHS